MDHILQKTKKFGFSLVYIVQKVPSYLPYRKFSTEHDDTTPNRIRIHAPPMIGAEVFSRNLPNAHSIPKVRFLCLNALQNYLFYE